MELIKKPFKIGNSFAVLVPKKWENEKILIKPLKRSIIEEIIEILNEKELLHDIKGIYLIGSYARGDYDQESDVDILAITENKKGLIKEKKYEITLMPEKNFINLVSKDLYLLTSIKEAVPLINEESLKKYKKIKQRLNIKEILEEIGRVLKINKYMIESCIELNEKIPDGTIYSLVLRLRELYILKAILTHKEISKKEFLSYIDKKSYNSYLRIKRDEKNTKVIEKEKAEELIKLSEKWLKELKEQKKT